MDGKQFSRSEAWLRQVEEIVCDVVLYFSNRGHSRDVSIEQTGLALGLSARKTKRIFYQEPTAVFAEDHQSVKRLFAEHLYQRERDLARRSREARLRRKQIELEL